ncbi:MAG: hypothetical protein HRT66_03015 [Flavobacteriaceae bacterium]|nr:hypothetical protein [Flavobacteriaceae bacterium]
MKKNIIILLGLIICFSCAEEPSYEIPKHDCIEPDIEITNSLGQIKEMYIDRLIGIDQDLHIEGYVVSDDEQGNIYKVISIQNDFENPTEAIQLIVDKSYLYGIYPVGTKLYISLKNLGLDKVNGVFQIGYIHESSLIRIPSIKIDDHIFKSCESHEVSPRIIDIKNIDDSLIGMLISIENIQFASEDFGLAYGNLNNTYSVNRNMRIYDELCHEESSLILRVSGYSSFKNNTLPVKKGTITGVLGKYNNDFQLYIRDLSDVNFTQSPCIPLLENTFQTGIVNNLPIYIDGWVNFTEKGSEQWSGGIFRGDYFAQFSAYGTDEDENIGWLITPNINFAQTDEVYFSFETSKRSVDEGFDGFEVLYSNDWDSSLKGVNTANWQVLEAVLASDDDDDYDWVNSGEIPLVFHPNGYYIAFKYTGSGTDTKKDGTYRVDNIRAVVR